MNRFTKKGADADLVCRIEGVRYACDSVISTDDLVITIQLGQATFDTTYEYTVYLTT